MIYPCQRCKEVFKSQEAVGLYLTRIQSCELRDVHIGDGVTHEIAEQLKSKKKSHRGETEEDRWQKIYQLLFHEALAPSPCELLRALHLWSHFVVIWTWLTASTLDFEPPDDRSELEEYSDYCRRELPRVVRAAIEEVEKNETQPLEEQLMGQLDHIVQIAHDRVFADYCAVSTDSVASSARLGDQHEINSSPLGTVAAVQSGQSYHCSPASHLATGDGIDCTQM